MPRVSQTILIPLIWIGCLHLAAWVVGRALGNRLLGAGPRSPSRLSAATIEFSLGLTLLANMALLLGAVRLLYRPVLLTAGIGLGAIGLLRIIRSRSLPRLRPQPEDAPLLLAIAFLATFLPYSLHPLLAHDDNVYHVFLPRLYLEHHALVPLPFNLYANMPHLVEVFYTWPLAIADFTAPKLASYSLHFWILAGLVGGCVSRVGRLGAGVVALLYVSGKNVQWHLGNAYVEPALGLFFLAGVLAFLAWYDTKNHGYLAVVATVCGAAFASKYTGWMFGSVILIVVLWTVLRSGPPTLSRVRDAGVVLAIAVGILLPWLAKNAIVTGNPIYPNLYEYFDGRFWSAIQELHYLRSQSFAGGPDSYLGSLPAVPVNLTVRDNFYYSPSFSAALMAMFLFGLLLPSAWRGPAAHVTVMALAGFLMWAFSVRQGRFLVAWIPVMALSASSSLVALNRRPRLLAAVATIVVAAGVWQLTTQRSRYEPPLHVVLSSRTDLIPLNFNYDLCQFLNRWVPVEGKVLGLWDNRFFFLRRPVIADSAYEAPSGLAWLRAAADPTAFATELRSLGITHVVIDHRVMNLYLHDGLPFPLFDERLYPPTQLASDRRLMERFIEEHLEEVRSWGVTVVYRLKAAPGR